MRRHLGIGRNGLDQRQAPSVATEGVHRQRQRVVLIEEPVKLCLAHGGSEHISFERAARLEPHAVVRRAPYLDPAVAREPRGKTLIDAKFDGFRHWLPLQA